MTWQIVRIHAAAPVKPALGLACNGCGVCCLAEPCPMGRLVFRRRQGPCPALIWQARGGRYVCGVLVRPRRFLRWLPAWAEPMARRWIARRIARGAGCDSDAVVESPD